MSRAIGISIAAVIFAAAILLAPLGASKDEWSDYDPAYAPGTGEGDWWVGYPEINPEAGSDVDHPEWVLDALKEKPVLIMGKDQLCPACKAQKESLDKVLETYGDDITFFEIMCDGSDKRGIDLLQIYDPTGGAKYVPTMVLLTLMPNSDDEVEVSWHGEEAVMDEEMLGDYVKDAIYYYEENSDEWLREELGQKV